MEKEQRQLSRAGRLCLVQNTIADTNSSFTRHLTEAVTDSQAGDCRNEKFC